MACILIRVNFLSESVMYGVIATAVLVAALSTTANKLIAVDNHSPRLQTTPR
jgi:hypothetical protein